MLGQALLAKRMGKTRLVAETGAGQHGVASATAAALMGLECKVYMGAVDVERQALNVFRMQLLGAEVEYVWHRESDVSGLDGLVIPGGFSYGDYLRSGAMAAEHIDRSVMGDRRSLGWVDGRSVMRPVPSVARVTSVSGPAERCR